MDDKLSKGARIKKRLNLANFLVVMLILADIPLFLSVYFVVPEQNTKLFIIAIYAIATLPAMYITFACYYKIHEMDKNDFDTIRKIEDYRLKRILLYLTLVIFSMVIINYITVSYEQSVPIIQDIINPLIPQSNSVPDHVGSILAVVSLVLFSHYGYTTTLASSVPMFKYYLAGFYLESAYKEHPKGNSSVKKFALFIKGIDNYDRYLRKALKHKIDRNRICSKIIADSSLILDENEKIKQLSNSFQSSNKLYPLKEISELLSNIRTDELIVRISNIDKLKESTEIVLAVISSAVAIVGLILR